MSLADQISKDRGQPATVRIGTVTSLLPLIVTTQGTPFADVGVIDGYVPVVGDVVAMLGQSAVSADGSSWLVLGRIVSGALATLGARTVSSGVDVNTVSTTSAVYVALTGAIPDVAAAFYAPSSGRVRVDWRAQLFADAGTTGKASFVLLTGLALGTGTVVSASADSKAIQTFGNTSSPEFGSFTLVTGLTPGAPYNVYMQQRRSGGAGNTFFANREIMVTPVP